MAFQPSYASGNAWPMPQLAALVSERPNQEAKRPRGRAIYQLPSRPPLLAASLLPLFSIPLCACNPLRSLAE
jgi:hypothetical protein